ncbi:cryptococcal mannosyltransferase 1-domain-containing protein [Mycena amicta]|nr:cryptococcal mannosyltransferase 1-domain-containing protein [Mycena amicta]
MFYDNEAVLPRWTTELLKLINYLGPDNVFVSIVESHSKDSTPALLRILDAHLVAARVPHRILIQLDDSLLPAGVKRPNPMQNKPPRIEFLAALRNIVLEPLYRARLGWDRDIDGDSEGDGEEKGEGEVAEGRWDKVLFSNDVFVEAESMAELLWTKEGQYDMACGMDFQQWGLYDLWVVRDRLGKSVSGLYPYFLEPQGFLAVMQDEPAEVYTCWNGIVVMDADPFLHPSMRRAGNSSSSSSSSSNTQLAFRGSNIAHGECFSSECFNLPYDLRRYFSTNSTSTSREITLPNPADPTRIYMNPRVIVAYKWSFYVYYKHVLRHWLVRWWMDRVEVGLGVGAGKVENRDLEATMKRREHAMQSARVILGDPRPTRIYEGYECHQPPI